MRGRIVEILKAIEHEEGVSILYACESGSRAWGFASPDSDYDVRFVYVRPEEDYLRLEPVRDVIEKMYSEEDVDLVGWDLRKALPLFGKSNPSFLEWLGSPVVYIKDARFVHDVEALRGAFFSRKACFLHYFGTAVSHDLRYLDKKGITLKRFLYYFRCLLCCKWLTQRFMAPPVVFEILFEEMIPEEDIREKTAEMLRMKARSKENDGANVDDALLNYAEKLRMEMEGVKNELEYQPKKPGERLERLFLKTVKAHSAKAPMRDRNDTGKDCRREGFFFVYDPEGFGWADVRIGIGEQEERFGASYIGHNPLEDMMEAANGLAREGYDRWLLRWESEPGTMEVELESDGEEVSVMVRRTNGDAYIEMENCVWEEKVRGVISLAELKEVVLEEAKRNLLLQGVVGFSKGWCEERDVFPMAEMLSLMGIEAKTNEDDRAVSPFAKELEKLLGLQDLQRLG